MVPHERPAQSPTPETTDLRATFACHLAEVASSGEEVVIRFDHTELIAPRIGHHNIAFVGSLADDAATKLDCLLDGVPLVVDVGAGQVKVETVRPGLLLSLSSHEAKPNLTVVARHKGAALLFDLFSIEHPGPERGDSVRIPDLEAHRDQPHGHPGKVAKAGSASA